MRSFKTIQLKDESVNRFQDNVKDAIDPLLRLPIIDGLLLENIPLTAGSANQISHKLGRVPRMWILADQSTNANVWRTEWTNALLTLNTSANCRVNLWVA
jgi:hypothetical protein